MQLEARLRAFSAFARRRSFSAAASELRISQPAVSKHIADLEQLLGLKLVERARRDGSLTSAGEFVANYVLRAESLLAQSVRGVDELRKSGSGSLVIVASWLTGTYLLPEIIAEFKYIHPGVLVSLELGTAKQAVERLRSHRAELGFIAGAVTGPEIEAEPLLENDIVIVGKPALRPPRISRDSLESLAWISREEGSATRSSSEVAMARLGIAPRQRLELPSYEAVVSALKRGYGISAIRRYVVADQLKSGTLVVFPVRGWKVKTVVSALRVRDVVLTPSAEQFQSLVRVRFAEIARLRKQAATSS
ncbi:LysR family transcriptional regulator [Rhodoplanes sp. Z2-YC6860]|uniref:LysR family transcriptional regulator n=1 Tax=Rhodoplanes sp. Z2-YC6860 TaxID=674703 RepID=UPI00078DE873|nr:LysR family transcriptional regulator [Rhodoplanes sp. Z2-YC6860]AMN44064.1 transcriptional regulator, LysR family [Rhodoplanes sp. Z2-YC6860]